MKVWGDLAVKEGIAERGGATIAKKSAKGRVTKRSGRGLSVVVAVAFEKDIFNSLTIIYGRVGIGIERVGNQNVGKVCMVLLMKVCAKLVEGFRKSFMSLDGLNGGGIAGALGGSMCKSKRGQKLRT